MGQSRKAPGRTAPPSGTPKPRSKTPDAPVVANGKSPVRSGAANDVTTSSKSHTKTHKSKKSHSTRRSNQPNFLLDHLIRYLLLSFVVYALLVCPSDTRLESPTCHAIYRWRLALEPYVVKPFHSFASHPSIQPVIQTVKPRYNEAVRRATPLLRSIQKTMGPRIQALRVRTRTVSYPYLQRLRHQYDIHLQPYLAKFEPHYRVTHRYLTKKRAVIRANLRPLIDQVQITTLERWENTIKPNVLTPVWERLLDVPVWFDTRFGDQARSLKSAYIDAQIKKMRSKIDELGGRSTVPVASLTITSFATESPIKGIKSLPTSATVPAQKTVSIVIAEDAVPKVSPTTLAHSPEAEIPTTPSLTIPVAGRTTPSAEPPVAEPEATPDKVGVSEPVPSSVSDAADPAPEDDPLEFLASFTAEPSATTTTTPEAPQWTEPSQEEIDRRQRQTAENRRKLEKRHADWEAKVEDEGKAFEKRLVDDITRIQSDALASLSEAAGDPGSIGAQLAAFKAEGAKALRGTSAYVDKLLGKHHTSAEKIGLVESVVAKVDQRYSEGAQALSEKVATWWSEIREEIDRVVIQAGKDVEGVALDGQSDMGMDYSYLDDVTVHDWTRYHDLVKRAKDILAHYVTVADGTAAGAPSDPLPSALAKMQVNMQEAFDKFQADLAVVRDAGIGRIKAKLASETSTSSSGEEPSFSILPVDERTRDEFVGRGREEILEAMSRAGESITVETEKSPLENENPAESTAAATAKHEEL